MSLEKLFPFGKWLNAWMDRHERRRLRDPMYALLRREVARIGGELESLSYDQLLRCDETHKSETVDGVNVGFNIEVRQQPDGELFVCVDASPTPLRPRLKSWPSYVFKKRKDGSVHYS